MIGCLSVKCILGVVFSQVCLQPFCTFDFLKGSQTFSHSAVYGWLLLFSNFTGINLKYILKLVSYMQTGFIDVDRFHICKVVKCIYTGFMYVKWFNVFKLVSCM